MVKLVIELHHVSQGGNQGEFRMVELVCRFHHVSSGGDQEKFLSGGASVWASPRESNGGGARGWASPRESKGGGAKGWTSPRMFIRELEMCPRVVKLVIGLHHQKYKKVKFMMEFHHRNLKERDASVGASP